MSAAIWCCACNIQLSDAVMKRIQREFKDILKAGTFEQSAALPAEAGEPHLAKLPRLKFRFDRHRWAG